MEKLQLPLYCHRDNLKLIHCLSPTLCITLFQCNYKVYTLFFPERQILNDPVKWENAVKMVLNTFEDAMKWTKNNTYKYSRLQS